MGLKFRWHKQSKSLSIGEYYDGDTRWICIENKADAIRVINSLKLAFDIKALVLDEVHGVG